MADQQPPSPQVSPIAAGAFPTLRVSHSAVWIAGGAFGINFLELRPIPNPSGVPAPVQQAHVEVGQSLLSPVALVQLPANSDTAIAQYRSLFGQDPPGPDKLPNDAMDAAKPALLGSLPGRAARGMMRLAQRGRAPAPNRAAAGSRGGRR
jgi:hypothetical protein